MDLKKTIDNIDSSINRIAEGVAKGMADHRTASKNLLDLARAAEILASIEREKGRSVGAPAPNKVITGLVSATDETPTEPDKNPAPQRRKRRTKAEIEAEKAAKTAVSGKTEIVETQHEKGTMPVEFNMTDIRKMVVEVVEKEGPVIAKGIIKKCGVDQLSDVPEDKYSYLATLVREALGEDKKDG